MITGANEFFLGRQPIVGRERELVAYELLFRAGENRAPLVFDDEAATAAVIQHTLFDLGVEQALGAKRGFINVSEKLLMSEVVEALPSESLALEILETVALTDEVAARCAHLRSAGFMLALDDVVGLSEGHRKILPFVHVVKVDLLAMEARDLPGLVKELRHFNVKLLAEKVETLAQYRACHELGFDLYQGYFFAEPVILSGRVIKPSTMALVKLTCLLAADAETEALEDVLKRAPDVALRLLRIANSVAFNPAQNKIANVRHAIVVLGRMELSRLVQIMIFSEQSKLDAGADPLVQLAAARGRMMEGLARLLGWSRLKDHAFMVGMLSLADVLFGAPAAEVARIFNLDETLREALCEHTGPLGNLLRLVKMSEREEADMAWELLQPLGSIGPDQYNRLQADAMAWAARL
jgi:EAL and modified HD-GYP domain-containing signal transduction protein